MKNTCTLLIRTDFYGEGLGGYGDDKDTVLAVYLDEGMARKAMQEMQEARTYYSVNYSIKKDFPLFDSPITDK